MNECGETFTPDEEERLIEIATDLLRRRSPPPDRTRCPPMEVVRDLAFRRRSLRESDCIIQHVAICSSCFLEYSQFRGAYKRRKRIHWGLLTIGLAVVALVWRQHRDR